MTLDADDREKVEELVAVVEDAGADIERVRGKRPYDEDPIEFKIQGIIP